MHSWILLFFLSSHAMVVCSQNRTSDPCKGKHDVVTIFGGIPGGEINVREHLNDSLYFTDDCINKDWGIASFHLALKCNGNVLKYFENKNGNQLIRNPELSTY